MTGLEKIIREIEDEAAAEAEATIAKAKEEADGLLQKAREDAQAASDKALDAASQSVADIEYSRDSALGLQKRQRSLETKQALLGETLALALKELYCLPEQEYFTLLLRLAAASAQNGEGVMMLNNKDKQRLPAGFEQQLAGVLPAGSSIKLASESRPIDGGFVLKYGDVEENCSFAAIFDARWEEFADMISPILFANA